MPSRNSIRKLVLAASLFGAALVPAQAQAATPITWLAKQSAPAVELGWNDHADSPRYKLLIRRVHYRGGIYHIYHAFNARPLVLRVRS